MQNNHAHVVAVRAIERASSSRPGHGGTGSDLSQEASQDQRREDKGAICNNGGGKLPESRRNSLAPECTTTKLLKAPLHGGKRGMRCTEEARIHKISSSQATQSNAADHVVEQRHQRHGRSDAWSKDCQPACSEASEWPAESRQRGRRHSKTM